VNPVRDEPRTFCAGGPVEYPHRRVVAARGQEGGVPLLHCVLRVGTGAKKRDRVDPYNRLLADDRHHVRDPSRQPHRRASVHVVDVVGSEGEDPASSEPSGDLLLGDGGRVGLAFESLND